MSASSTTARLLDLRRWLAYDIDDAGQVLAGSLPALGEACGGIQSVLDPELFVIGGGVADLGERLLGPARTAFAAALPGYGQHPVASFAIATLGNDAGLIGVADLAGGRV